MRGWLLLHLQQGRRFRRRHRLPLLPHLHQRRREYNRLTDVPTQDLEAVAKSIAAIDTNGYNLGVVSEADYEAAVTAYQNAQAQTKLVQAQIVTARAAATGAKCANIDLRK
jgi:hypothetical protein